MHGVDLNAMCEDILQLFWEAYITTKVSNDVLSCLDILDYNILVDTKNTKEGEGIPK